MQYFSFELINTYSNTSTLYTEKVALNDQRAQTLTLRISNIGDTDIHLSNLAGDPNKDNYHFKLFFPGNVLSDSTAKTNLDPVEKGSSVRISKAEQGVIPNSYTFYIICPDTVLKQNTSLNIELQHFMASDRPSSGYSDITLDGVNFKDKKGNNIPDEALKTSFRISVENRLINRQLPLQFSFRDHNLILNEDNASNSLELVAVNMTIPEPGAPSSESDLVFAKDSTISIGFDVQLANESKSWAMGTESEVKNYTVSLPKGWTQLRSESGAGKYFWTFSPDPGTTFKLHSLAELLVTIQGIKTSLASGYTNLYFQFRDVPNYGSGEFLVPVLKTPLVTKGSMVGVGVLPKATLEVGTRNDIDHKGVPLIVNGRIQSSGDAGGLWVDSDCTKFVGANGPSEIGLWAGGFRLTADTNGKVRIPGTLEVDNQVNVGGELTIAGAATVRGKLEVTGNNHISGALSVDNSINVKNGQLRFLDATGKPYPDNWIGVMPIPNQGPNWLHIGGVTGTDNQRRIALEANIVTTPNKIGIGTTEPNMSLSIAGRGNGIELGAEVKDKQVDAGRIIYKKYSDSLDIIGAGEEGKNNRSIKMWAEGGTNFTGPITVGNYQALIYWHQFPASIEGINDTKVPTSEYIAFIGGYYANNYDVQELKSHDWYFRMEKYTAPAVPPKTTTIETWRIDLNLPDDNSYHPNWMVNVLFISKKIAKTELPY